MTSSLDEAGRALHTRIAELIERLADGARDDAARDALLSDVLAWQSARVPAYGRLVAQWPPGDVRRPEHWPAIPTDLFRHLRIASHPPEADVRVFQTSGTTQSSRGRHALPSLALYDLAARYAAQHALFGDRARMRLVILAPSADQAPDSSLSYMLSRFVTWFGDAHSVHVWDDGRLQLPALCKALDEACATDVPVALLGTSFAFVHAEDGLAARRWQLPPGSRIMQTGGFKGRSREVTPDDMLAMLEARYGVPHERTVQEYGMTELSSQLYASQLNAPRSRPGQPSQDQSLSTTADAPPGGATPFWVPGWVRVSIVDPETLTPLREGPGLVRIEDLANLHTACAIQTADLGRWAGDTLHGADGERGLWILGRAADATPRGCSLAVDELLSRRT